MVFIFSYHWFFFRMFSFLEKEDLSKILKKYGGELGYLDDDQMAFLREMNLLRFQRNYAIFPKSTHKKTGYENIVLISTLEGNFDLGIFIREILDCLAPPFRIQIDFGFLLYHPLRLDYRYLWPSRYTALPLPSLIRDDNDRELYYSKFIQTPVSEIALEQHQNQCQ